MVRERPERCAERIAYGVGSGRAGPWTFHNAANDTLYVASSSDNAIYEIPTATKTASTANATLLFQDFTHLHGPIDLVILPNGHFLVATATARMPIRMSPVYWRNTHPPDSFWGRGRLTPTTAAPLVWQPVI